MDSQINEQYIPFRICAEDEQILYRREIVRLQPVEAEDSAALRSFHATYYDSMGRERPLGPVKFGRRGVNTVTALSQEFTALPAGWVSLGQDEDYYENISHLEPGTREVILEELRDLARDASARALRGALLRRIAPDEKVALAKVRSQFHKMTNGSARLTPYHFTYTAPEPASKEIQPVKLEFSVDPKPYPPTNVHALIGRNGCGKTYLIRHMVQCLQNGAKKYGEFRYEDETGLMREFVNVICIAFSPFDDFAELIQKNGAIPGTFVGVNKSRSEQTKAHALQEMIFEDFWNHFCNCLITERKQALWKRAIGILKSDVLFEREQIDEFMDELTPESSKDTLERRKGRIRDVFGRLSSGHKVVLLIITSCVAEVEERSILFLDEPENHLHPPLLSALIRALSDLLMDRNGVAIISTHSPIVLQEIPSSCVWVLDRDENNQVSAERPDRETFGTNLGALIYDTFDLEMGRSGFRTLIRDAIELYDSYEEVDDTFDGHLGNEASLLLRTLIMLRERGV